MKSISSRHNPLVARFRDAARSIDRSGAHLLLDGVHLVRDAHASGVWLDLVAVAASHLAAHTEEADLARTLADAGIDVVVADDRVFAAMSPVSTPSGIAALATRQPVAPAAICAHPEAFVLAAADVQDPGNLGSMIRAAEAAGATGAFVCGTSASPFAWKALRGSMGSALRLPTAAGLSAREALQCLRQARIRTIAAVPRGGLDPDAIDWRERLALFLGGEGPGLDGETIAVCDARVTIPMAPRVESLNVAVAAGILCYAVRRRRSGPTPDDAPVAFRRHPTAREDADVS